jgi:hypothetical protein
MKHFAFQNRVLERRVLKREYRNLFKSDQRADFFSLISNCKWLLHYYSYFNTILPCDLVSVEMQTQLSKKVFRSLS